MAGTNLRRAALRIAGIYAILGAVWILFSDRLIRLIVARPDEVTWLQSGKGWLFVLGAALMIYLLVHRRLVSIDRLRKGHEESPAERREVPRELERLECQLQAARLESIGQLAGGISHDFNNVLGAILGYCDLLLYQVDSASPLRQDVIEIQKAAKRGSALAGQLLAFSRKRESLLSVLSLNDIVDELVDMLCRLVGTSVELKARLDPALGYVKADATRLGQVVMNLVVNARDAMPDGGTITIETANVELDEEYAAAHPSAKPGPHVMLAVSDTGFGMDEATQSRIFEPYFTTKGPGKGTGLGLSTVYNIVKDSRGNIWVYSTPGRGTTFRVYLPQVSEAGAPLVAREAPAELPGGRETILVVDDEEALQLLMSRGLERSGYSVLVAGDGKSALELAGGYKGPIHAMITDLMLPEMTGLDLAERLVGSRPEMKVLYVSGHGDLDVVRPGAFRPGMAFLQKPFTPSALVGKLRHTLDTSAGDGERTRLDHRLASATG
ncbi:MAG: ATP-binding protein [Gemmatimonadales bacterium]|jgi:signal transduction histidine kinase/CheY-like chemotaxis protein